MIAVENPTADLVNTLAARSDVARIMGNPLVKLKLPHNPVTLASHAAAGGPEQNIVRIGDIHDRTIRKCSTELRPQSPSVVRHIHSDESRCEESISRCVSVI